MNLIISIDRYLTDYDWFYNLVISNYEIPDIEYFIDNGLETYREGKLVGGSAYFTHKLSERLGKPVMSIKANSIIDKHQAKSKRDELISELGTHLLQVKIDGYFTHGMSNLLREARIQRLDIIQRIYKGEGKLKKRK